MKTLSTTPASKWIALAVAASMVTACQQGGDPGPGIMQGGSLNKQDVGTAVGAIGGGVLGSTIGSGAGQTAAIIGGALLGGMLGNSVGRSMDNADRAEYDRAAQDALESGAGQSWRNPDSGHHGTFTPTNEYTNAEGFPCREYTQSIYINNKRTRGHGTACRQMDGSWHIVND